MPATKSAYALGAAFPVACLAAIVLSAAPRPHMPQAAAQAPAPAQIELKLDPAQSRVHWTLPASLHTVHGTFKVQAGEISVDPQSGKATGEIVVAATSGESGNDSRDGKMHKEVLESAKYPDAVFRPAQVDGKIPASGPCDVKLRGKLTVRGAEHEVVADVHAALDSRQWKGTAKFDVPYVSWGMKDPSNFLLKVKPVVNIEVEMSGSVAAER